MSDTKTLYTAHVHVTGGREGAARSSDGRLDLKLAVPGSPGAGTIDAEVDLRHGEDGYALAARLNVSVPGVEPEIARQLIEAAHRTCPYSKAIKGNIDAVVALV